MGAVLFVTGGARSGKSAFAQRLADASHRDVVFVATMQPLDEELAERVARHQSVRPTGWRTIEEPLDLAGALAGCDPRACVLLDCISLWVTNRLLPLGDPPSLDALSTLEAELDAHIDVLLRAQEAREGELIVVTNEVGGGVVPPSALGRAYRDLLGRANQRVSARASSAWLLVAGRALELPPPF